MAKVGKIHFQFEGEFGKEYELHYTQTSKFSVKGLPKEFIDCTEFRTSEYDTEAALRTAAGKACKKYRELKTKSRKVILIRCAASTHLRMNRHSSSSYSGLRPGISDKIQDLDKTDFDVCAVLVEYEVCTIVDDGVRPQYHRMSKDDNYTTIGAYFNIDYSKKWIEIEYTPERVEFFERMYHAMYEMVVSLSNFFGKEPAAIAAIIDSSPLSLPLNLEKNEADD